MHYPFLALFHKGITYPGKDRRLSKPKKSVTMSMFLQYCRLDGGSQFCLYVLTIAHL